MPAPIEKGLGVGVLKELAKSTLIEKLNDVRSGASHIIETKIDTDKIDPRSEDAHSGEGTGWSTKPHHRGCLT